MGPCQGKRPVLKDPVGSSIYESGGWLEAGPLGFHLGQEK
jgi:hypothetical protein